MSSGFRKQFDELRASASTHNDGDTLYSLDIKPIYAAKGDKEPAGSLLPASEVKVLKRDGDWLQVQIEGWTETDGRQRVLTQLPGKRIFCRLDSRRCATACENAGRDHRRGDQYSVEQITGNRVDAKRRHGK